MKLELNDNPSDPQASEQRFQTASQTLLCAAVGQAPSSDLSAKLADRSPIDVAEANRRIRLVRDDFSGGIPGGYSRMLSIDCRPDYRAPFEIDDS